MTRLTLLSIIMVSFVAAPLAANPGRGPTRARRGGDPEFVRYGGGTTKKRPDRRLFELGNYHRSTPKTVLARRVPERELGTLEGPLPLGFKARRKLDTKSLRALQRAFERAWEKPFVGGVYGPFDGSMGAGNGATGNRFFATFQYRMDEKANPDSLRIKWPSPWDFTNQEWDTFKLFSRGEARAALESTVRMLVGNIVRANPKHFEDLYQSGSRRWFNVTIGAIEYWSDMSLLKERSPATHEQVRRTAKRYGYEVQEQPLNRSGGGIHGDPGLKVLPGVQSLMVVAKYPGFRGGDTIVYPFQNGRVRKDVAVQLNGEEGEQVLWGLGDGRTGSAHLAGPFHGGGRLILVVHLETDPGLPDANAGGYGFEKRQLRPSAELPGKTRR